MIKISNYICQEDIQEMTDKIIILSSSDQEYNDPISLKSLLNLRDSDESKISFLRLKNTYRFLSKVSLFSEEIKRQFRKNYKF